MDRLILGFTIICIFAWAWMDEGDNERWDIAAALGACGAGFAGAIAVGDLVFGFLGAFVAYGLGFRGYFVLVQADDGGFVTWAWSLLLPVAPLMAPACLMIPAQTRQHAKLAKVAEGHRRWREEFRLSGAVDPETFVPQDPLAVRPPNMGSPVPEEPSGPPPALTTARLGNARALRQMQERQQARAKNPPDLHP